jgi:choline dehydrogenase-like flavoprotein
MNQAPFPQPANSDLGRAIRATTLEVLRRERSHDAIVIGAGAAGGFAALSLAEAGLRVLVLDAGWRRSFLSSPIQRSISGITRRLADPKMTNVLPPVIVSKGRAALKMIGRWRQPIQTQCYAWERLPEAFVDDRDQPYTTPSGLPFNWIRARQLGGRMVIPGHGRQYYRLSPDDFAPADDLSPRWPLDFGELDPWYSLVERRLGLSGTHGELSGLPDSEINTILTPTPAESGLHDAIKARWPTAQVGLGRYAPPLASLDLAASTGNIRCRQGAVVQSIDVNDKGAVKGVVWYDEEGRTKEYARAPLVFLCASSLETTRILLLSRSEQHPNGIGAGSGALGRFLMDHVMVGAIGITRKTMLAETKIPEDGRCSYLRRFDRRNPSASKIKRGYDIQVYQRPGLPGQQYFFALAFAEMLPRRENRIKLDPIVRDSLGIPVLSIECKHDASDLELAREQTSALCELADVAGASLRHIDEKPLPPGMAVHECGTARMGSDPTTSVLDPYNQCWDAQGLYVTDGASFPSQGSQNPTLTMLALTARACARAVST